MNIEIDMRIIKKTPEKLLGKLSDSQKRFCKMELGRYCIIETIPLLVETCRSYI